MPSIPNLCDHGLFIVNTRIRAVVPFGAVLTDLAVNVHRSFTVVSLSDRKSTRLNSSHSQISYAVFCLKKKKKHIPKPIRGTTLSDSQASDSTPLVSISMWYRQPPGVSPQARRP